MEEERALAASFRSSDWLLFLRRWENKEKSQSESPFPPGQVCKLLEDYTLSHSNDGKNPLKSFINLGNTVN